MHKFERAAQQSDRRAIAMAPAARIRRGFNRLGIVAAALVAISAGTIAGGMVAEWVGAQNKEFDRHACLLRAVGGQKLEGMHFRNAALANLKCGYFSEIDTFGTLTWLKPDSSLWVNGRPIIRYTTGELVSQALQGAALGLAITALLAGATYLVFFSIGWIVAGFARDASAAGHPQD